MNIVTQTLRKNKSQNVSHFSTPNSGHLALSLNAHRVMNTPRLNLEETQVG